MEKEENGKIYRSVLIPGVARKLLKLGNPIYDIKAKRENPDATNFIFEVTEKFKSDMDYISTNYPYLFETNKD